MKLTPPSVFCEIFWYSMLPWTQYEPLGVPPSAVVVRETPEVE